MASFYVQISEEEMSDELVFGSEAYQEMVRAFAARCDVLARGWPRADRLTGCCLLLWCWLGGRQYAHR
eukprot:COSAG01_NODE_3087_length_6609_cov_2.598925_8_plen_68_part_00